MMGRDRMSAPSSFGGFFRAGPKDEGAEEEKNAPSSCDFADRASHYRA
jgi:hypothetical protein